MDGNTAVLTANIIAENLTAQVDENGNRHLLIEEIEGHRINEEAIPMNQGTYKKKSGFDRKIRTTKGWELYVR